MLIRRRRRSMQWSEKDGMPQEQQRRAELEMQHGLIKHTGCFSACGGST